MTSRAAKRKRAREARPPLPGWATAAPALTPEDIHRATAQVIANGARRWLEPANVTHVPVDLTGIAGITTEAP